MEIRNIQDIDNREYRSQIREITAITNDPNVVAGTTVDNCLNEVFILLKNGDYDHFVANPNDINARTEETTDFLRLLENWGNQTGVTLSAPYFTQLSLGTQNKDKKRAIKEIRADYRDYLKSNSSDDEYDDEDAKKPLSLGKKAAIAAGTVGLATAIGVGGVAGYNHFKNRDDASIEVQTDEAQGFDLNLEGKDFAYYENDANIPASLQKDFALRNSDSPYNFLTSFNSTSTVDGQTYKTGYTYRQLFYADIFFNGNSYSNDELLTILANFDIMEDQYDENGSLVSSVTTYDKMTIQDVLILGEINLNLTNDSSIMISDFVGFPEFSADCGLIVKNCGTNILIANSNEISVSDVSNTQNEIILHLLAQWDAMGMKVASNSYSFAQFENMLKIGTEVPTKLESAKYITSDHGNMDNNFAYNVNFMGGLPIPNGLYWIVGQFDTTTGIYNQLESLGGVVFAESSAVSNAA